MYCTDKNHTSHIDGLKLFSLHCTCFSNNTLLIGLFPVKMTYLNTFPASLGRKGCVCWFLPVTEYSVQFYPGRAWAPGSISGLLHCNPYCGSLWHLLLASSVLADIGTIIGNTSACHKQVWRVESKAWQGCVHSKQAKMRLTLCSKSRLMSVFFISENNQLIFKAAFPLLA